IDHPLADICASFPNDPIMNEARDFCRGLRIIRQPKWECLATFICSSMKQVAHIRQISLALRRRFGERRKIGTRFAYSFPQARRIARASENDLRKCALGYRARNLLMTARLVSSGKADLKAWSADSWRDNPVRICANHSQKRGQFSAPVGRSKQSGYRSFVFHQIVAGARVKSDEYAPPVSSTNR